MFHPHPQFGYQGNTGFPQNNPSIPFHYANPLSSKLPLKLMPRQRQQFDIIKLILTESFPIAMDTSPPGSGKSMNAMELANFTKLPYVVFCPASVVDGWNRKIKQYHTDGPNLDVRSYSKLIISRNSNDSNLVITKDLEYVIGKIVSTPKNSDSAASRIDRRVKGIQYTEVMSYTVSPRFMEQIRRGILIFMDESHSFKNPNASTTKSMTAICRFVIKYVFENPECPTRILFMSATPMDDIKQTVTFLRLFDISTKTRVIQSGRTFSVDGYAYDLIKYASRYINRQDVLDELLEKYGIPVGTGYELMVGPRQGLEKDLKNLCFEILSNIIFPTLSSTMPSSDKNVYRGFFQLDFDGTKKNSLQYRKYVADLSEQISKLIRTGNVDNDRRLIAKAINDALSGMEEACVDAICKFLHMRLLLDERCKVVAAFSYKKNVAKFINYFTNVGFKTLEFTGSVGLKERIENRRRFQGGIYENKDGRKEEKDPDEFRVMCITTAAGGTGLDFHDEEIKGVVRGRILAITPSYKSNELKQTSGRVQRFFVVQDDNGNPVMEPDGNYMFKEAVSEVYLFFGIGEEGATATGLISSLYRRAEVTRRSIIDNWPDSVRLFPGEYPRYIQGVGYIDEKQYSMTDDAGNVKTIDTSNLISMVLSNSPIKTVDGSMSYEMQNMINRVFTQEITLEAAMRQLPPVKYGLAESFNSESQQSSVRWEDIIVGATYNQPQPQPLSSPVNPIFGGRQPPPPVYNMSMGNIFGGVNNPFQ